jgi:hypothetical protein
MSCRVGCWLHALASPHHLPISRTFYARCHLGQGIARHGPASKLHADWTTNTPNRAPGSRTRHRVRIARRGYRDQRSAVLGDEAPPSAESLDQRPCPRSTVGLSKGRCRGLEAIEWRWSNLCQRRRDVSASAGPRRRGATHERAGGVTTGGGVICQDAARHRHSLRQRSPNPPLNRPSSFDVEPGRGGNEVPALARAAGPVALPQRNTAAAARSTLGRLRAVRGRSTTRNGAYRRSSSPLVGAA